MACADRDRAAVEKAHAEYERCLAEGDLSAALDHLDVVARLTGAYEAHERQQRPAVRITVVSDEVARALGLSMDPEDYRWLVDGVSDV